MRDRVGQVWEDGDATFLVLAPAVDGPPGNDVVMHLVLIIGSRNGWFPVGETDLWPENASDPSSWERRIRRLG